MKRKLILKTLLCVTTMIAGMGYIACGRPDNDRPNNSGGPEAVQPRTDVEDMAMIVRVEKDVSMKSKGANEFVPILSGLFRGGDLLQVGEQSIAWVACSGLSVCPLGKGLYDECCRIACDNGIRIQPPQDSMTQNRVMFINKAELPSYELQMLELQEAKIRNLGTDEVTTKFLLADLYSSWKLVEARDQVRDLSRRLDDPATKRELKTLYLPMLRTTGDMQQRINQKGEAEQSYKKAVERAPQFHDTEEKAAAHVSLGELYEETGQKEKAVVNLKKGERLYETVGNDKKAAETRKVIVRVQQ